MSDLFCLRCGVYAHRNHNPRCSIMSLIPVTPVCKSLALQLDRLSLEPMSAGCFIEHIPEALYDYRITFDIEFRHELPPVLSLSPNWHYYNQIVGTDFEISAIGYSEVYAWIGIESPQERAQQIANDFSKYLSTLDKFALRAIRTLYNT